MSNIAPFSADPHCDRSFRPYENLIENPPHRNTSDGKHMTLINAMLCCSIWINLTSSETNSNKHLLNMDMIKKMFTRIY